MKTYKRVLTIAGSDSGGAAGIQADLKTISACGCYGMSSITAITAQNTTGVKAIEALPIGIIEQQIRACLDDIGVDAIKIGMLHSVEVIRLISKLLVEYNIENAVLDPVMVATSGDILLPEEAINSLIEELFPLVKIITPNLYEIELLAGKKIKNQNDLYDCIPLLKNSGAKNVLFKAGHLEADYITDVLADYVIDKTYKYTYEKINTLNTNGTGCSLSSAIASFLTFTPVLEEAVQSALDYIHEAILHGKSYKIGKGNGPILHFYKCWD